ncbi:MFS transporter [Polycladidibacter stylochi]|uniref:MFS transporter n=1 Tax=Polycladidibacter stylochi TaxID=1807766 RepID=UPI00083512BA|nr:MFS transporter [Pseudovibrio stylochi]
MAAFAGSVNMLLLVVFLRSCADSLFAPAKQTAIQRLCEKEQLPKYNGYSHAINQSSKVLGPAIGGALMLVLPIPGIFMVNALISLISIVFFVGLVIPNAQEDPTDKPEVEQNSRLQAVLAFLRTNPVVLASLALMMFSYLILFMYDRFIPFIIDDFGFSSSFYSIVVSFVGVGGVIGALLAPKMIRLLAFWPQIALGFSINALYLALIGYWLRAGMTPQSAALLLVFMVAGFSSALVMVVLRCLLQENTAPKQMGQVFSYAEAVSTLAMLGGPFLGTYLSSSLGYDGLFTVCMSAFLCLALLVMTTRIFISLRNSKQLG